MIGSRRLMKVECTDLEFFLEFWLGGHLFDYNMCVNRSIRISDLGSGSHSGKLYWYKRIERMISYI